MMSLNRLKRASLPRTPRTPATPSGMTKPPTNIEEFLAITKKSDWPPPPEPSELAVQLLPEQFINKNSIATKLLQAAPLSMAGFGTLRKSIEIFDNQVSALSDHFIQKKALVPVLKAKKTFFAPPETFLTEIAESEIVQSLAGVKKTAKVVQTGANEEAIQQDERCTNVLKANFPGIRADAATDLPNWIELPAIVEKVAQAVDVQANLRPMWRQIYLSQGSIVLIQDGFWYLFLDYFKQSEDDVVAAKDKFFDRMSDTYVTLLFSVDRSVRDKFFKDYTSIVAQSIFLCFADAFPDSQYLYDDAFKSYLANSVSLWLQGVKAVPGVFKTWSVNSMLKADQIEAERKQRQANMVFDPTTLDVALAQLSARGNMTNRKGTRPSVSPTHESRQMLQPQPSIIPPLPKALATATKPESLPIGPGAQIERVKFRLTGNSQLLDHHMRMHGIPITTGSLAVRSQEIPSLPQTTQTYADLINESKKAMKEFDKNMADLEKQTADEISRIHKQYIADKRRRAEDTTVAKDNKRAARAMDPARAAAEEVREMMKHAFKSERRGKTDDEELAASLALGL